MTATRVVPEKAPQTRGTDLLVADRSPGFSGMTGSVFGEVTLADSLNRVGIFFLHCCSNEGAKMKT